MEKSEVIKAIKEEWPDMNVIRIDELDDGKREMWVYGFEPHLCVEGDSTRWGGANDWRREVFELVPFAIFERLLEAVGADPATWELRLD